MATPHRTGRDQAPATPPAPDGQEEMATPPLMTFREFMDQPFMSFAVLRQVLRSCSDPYCRETHVDLLPEPVDPADQLAKPKSHNDADGHAATPSAPATTPRDKACADGDYRSIPATARPQYEPRTRDAATAKPVQDPDTTSKRIPVRKRPKRSPYNMRRRNPPTDP